MAIFLLVKKAKVKKIRDFSYDVKGYEFKPNINNPKFIKISELYLMNENMANVIIKNKIEKIFRRLTTIIYSILNDEDASSSDAIIALDEITKQKEIILIKYNEYLKKDLFDKYKKRLYYMEKELKEHLILLELREKNLEKGRSR